MKKYLLLFLLLIALSFAIVLFITYRAYQTDRFFENSEEITQNNLQNASNGFVQVQGTLKTCQYTMGEATCGKCYCVEIEGRGCDIVSIPSDMDVASFVGMTGEISLDRGFSCNRTCPCSGRLVGIAVR